MYIIINLMTKQGPPLSKNILFKKAIQYSTTISWMREYMREKTRANNMWMFNLSVSPFDFHLIVKVYDMFFSSVHNCSSINVTKSKVWARARCDCERRGTSWLPGRTSWPGSPRHSSWHSSSRDRWQLHMWSSFHFKSYFAAGDLLDPHLVLLPDPLLHEHWEQHGEDLVHRREPTKQGFQEKSRLNLYFCTRLPFVLMS